MVSIENGGRSTASTATGATGLPRIGLWLLAGLAFALMLVQFLYNRSFWIDEVWLALNIRERTAAELLGTLDYNQVAPVGFLLLSKTAVGWFGDRDWVLRLVPMGFAAASIVVAWQTVRAPGQYRLGLQFVLLTFVNPLVIYYASEFKQYIVEFCASLVGLCLYLKYRSQADRLVRAFSGLLIVGIWFSNTLYVVTGGVVLYLLISARTVVKRVKAINPVWPLLALSVLALHYFTVVEPNGNRGYMREYYYAQGGLFHRDAGLSYVRWVASHVPVLLGVFKSFNSVLVKLGLAGVFAWALPGALVAGLFARSTRAYRPVFGVTLAAAGVHFLLASVGWYPLDTRFLLYWLPLAAFCLAVLLDGLIPRARWFYALAAILLFVSAPGFRAHHPSAYPFEIDDVKASLRRMEMEGVEEWVVVGLAGDKVRYYRPGRSFRHVSEQEAFAVLQRSAVARRTAVLFSRLGMTAGFDRALERHLEAENLPAQFFEDDNSCCFIIAPHR